MKRLKVLFVVIFSTLLLGTTPNKIAPDVITEQTKYDTDDPAIWINRKNPAKSIVFGTDKHTNGAIYAFDLKGNIIENKTLRGIKRPNNIDVAYDFKINDSVRVDILAFTEREREQVRIFSVPDMIPIDGGGLKVFEDEKNSNFRKPMGISIYSSPVDNEMYLIVGRKKGPKENYLYQYKLKSKKSQIEHKLVRKFGRFSGKKEIEAIAVDDELGFIYYSDEGHCIRKYYAEPSKGNKEISCFGGKHFKGDIEGIAIVAYEDMNGYLIVSNQDKNTFNVFSRNGNKFVKEIDLKTRETDGCKAVTGYLNETFNSGLFVAMNNDRNFYMYNLSRLGLKK
jgi:3-phytase